MDVSATGNMINKEELMLKHPFSMMVAGSRRTGKTFFTKKLLEKKSEFMKPEISFVFWFSPSTQNEIFSELERKLDDTIKFVKGLPSEDILDFIHTHAGSKLLIFDDLMEEASKRADVKNLFTRGRHENVSVIFLSQNTFHQGKHFREMSLNSDYFVLFKNVRDATTIKYFARQTGMGDFLIKAYQDATKDVYSHFFMDMRSDTDDKLRFRSKIFEFYPVLYIKNV